MGRRKRRLWSDDEKREICRQTGVPGVSVAQVGRRYAVNANLIFKWLKVPRFAPDVVEGEAETIFLPVEVGSSDVVDPTGLPVPDHSAPGQPPTGRITIELSGGHRLCAEGGFDPDLLARLLKGIIS